MTTPAELVRRGLLKGPLITMANSSPNQWAGQTTLSSGSATVTVSTFQVNSDCLIQTTVLAALPAAYTTRGRSSIAAGVATATVSTTAVYSGQVIGLAWQGASNQASGQGRAFRVDSIVDGVSFAITTEDGQNVSSGPALPMWSIAQAEPYGIKVNTISPNNFFTMGWADQQARPVDVTLMFEVRKTS